ncbi:DUF58 domain-containing protein [Bacillus velezensis]|uniref:DUF58 domain-containing protein n=1 Tax=Bacillus velezensis TaxID=492670 RepID=UPI0009B178EF|nr:DUF58 domain-containing protein [Bacillus velezensis]MEC1108333.1 DUF58 domain-containing protein [Bacillus velezensis]OQC77627.1 hypothetical protein BKK82_18475 [Bacillus velezensis]
MRKKMHWLLYGWKLLMLAVLTAAVFSYAMFQGGFVSWFLFYAFLPFIVYAGLVAVYPLRAFQVARDVSSAQLTSGDRLSVTIRLARRLPFPLTYMVIEDVMPETLGERRSAKQLVFPWFQRKLTLQYELPQVPRGEHHLHTIRVRTGDVLGLLDKTASFSVTDTVLVFPAYGSVHYKPQAASGEEGAAAGAPFQVHRSAMAASVRNYQPGDRFSALDWKTSARRNELMTKEFDPLQSVNIILLLDCRPSPSFEAAVSASASLLYTALVKGSPAGFISLGSDRTVFPVREGDRHFRKMLRYLASASESEEADAGGRLGKELADPRVRKASIAVVTGSLTEDLLKQAEPGRADMTVFLAKETNAALSEKERKLALIFAQKNIKVQMIRDKRVSHVV